MTRERFRQLVSEALDTIPARFRRHLKNIAIVVEDEPSPALLDEMEVEAPDTLFGLYQGTPLTERRWDYGNVLPDRIVLFQGPIEDVSETEDDVVTEIGETLIHEVGHYFGLSEEEIEAIEDRYWDRRQETGAGSPDDGDEGEDEDDESAGEDGR
jgi:predicted Zn-dependent protease with MMP-like domain